jgi:dihydropteroate synthase
MTVKLSPLTIGKREFDFIHPYIMGILNITPDSFSDGGEFYNPQKAIEHALRMQTEGADIVDIGGESTRPGSEPIAADEEIDRVMPVIEALVPKLEIPISIDTRKSMVAEIALDAGAAMINDISGLKGDPRMAELAASKAVPVVVMHIKGKPKTMQADPYYDDLLGEIEAYFRESIEIAETAGVDKNRIILDPGIGFGKTYEDNFKLIKNLREFEKFGCPLLVGASRKRFLSIDDTYAENERLEQSLAMACAAVLNGAQFVRVHDVLPTVKALRAISRLQNV